MSETVTGVDYYSPLVGRLAVERLGPEQVTDSIAKDFLLLETAAYSHELEGGEYGAPLLPQGSVAAYYRPNSRRSNRVAEYSMREEMAESGRQYWYIRTDSGTLALPPQSSDLRSSQVIAAACLIPTTHPWDVEHYSPDGKPYCGIRELIVHPTVQRRGLGSALIHAALSGGGIPDNSSVNIDGYEGSPVTSGFIEGYLGLLAVSPAPSIFVHVHLPLQATRFMTTGRMNLKTLRERLENKKPWLRTANLRPAD